MKYLYAFIVLLSIYSCTDDKNMGMTTVYKTNTGKKYHISSCRYLAQSSIPIFLKDAVAEGYKPCWDCNPPVYTLPEKPGDGSGDPVQPASGYEEAAPTETVHAAPETPSTRCKGITKKNKRCKRMTTNASGFCFQHDH